MCSDRLSRLLKDQSLELKAKVFNANLSTKERRKLLDITLYPEPPRRIAPVFKPDDCFSRDGGASKSEMKRLCAESARYVGADDGSIRKANQTGYNVGYICGKRDGLESHSGLLSFKIDNILPEISLKRTKTSDPKLLDADEVGFAAGYAIGYKNGRGEDPGVSYSQMPAGGAFQEHTGSHLHISSKKPTAELASKTKSDQSDEAQETCESSKKYSRGKSNGSGSHHGREKAGPSSHATASSSKKIKDHSSSEKAGAANRAFRPKEKVTSKGKGKQRAECCY